MPELRLRAEKSECVPLRGTRASAQAVGQTAGLTARATSRGERARGPVQECDVQRRSFLEADAQGLNRHDAKSPAAGYDPSP